MGKNIKKRQGRVADIARLDIHDFFGNLISRTKGKVHEKTKGAMMIQQIKERFELNDEDLATLTADILRNETMDQRGLKSKPLEWTRDEKGRIVSPFSPRAERERV